MDSRGSGLLVFGAVEDYGTKVLGIEYSSGAPNEIIFVTRYALTLHRYLL